LELFSTVFLTVFGPIRPDSARFGPIRPDSARFGPIRPIRPLSGGSTRGGPKSAPKVDPRGSEGGSSSAPNGFLKTVSKSGQKVKILHNKKVPKSAEKKSTPFS